MQQLFEKLKTDTSIRVALDAFCAERRQNLIYGITGSQKSLITAAGMSANPRPIVIVTSSNETLDQWKNDLTSFLPEKMIVDLPAADVITFTAAAKSLELSARRTNTLGQLARGESIIVLVTAEGACQKVLPKQEFLNNRVTLTNGGTVNREGVIEIIPTKSQIVNLEVNRFDHKLTVK